MTRDEFRAEILKAATYHADEGTSGYLLGEDQVEAIMRAADEYAGREPDVQGDGGTARVRVTAFDLGTGESNSVVIEDDYVLICAGTCHRHYVEDRFDGTHVITVKGRKQAMPARPTMAQLWDRAGEDPDEYRRLLREHGYTERKPGGGGE